jgi:hypothetical protein
MNEGKKDRRDPIRTIKARNPVAKNATSAIGGGAAGAHKDKKKAMKQGDVKHKKAEYAESYEAYLGRQLNELSIDSLKSYKEKRQAQQDAAKAAVPNPRTGDKDWIDQAVRNINMSTAQRKINRKEKAVGEEYNAEGDDPNLAKAYRMGNAAFRADNKDALKTIPKQYREMWIRGWHDGERFASEKDVREAAQYNKFRVGQRATFKNSRGQEFPVIVTAVDYDDEAVKFKSAENKPFPNGELEMEADPGWHFLTPDRAYDPNSLVRATSRESRMGEGFNAEYDDEAGMADNNLHTLKNAVEGIDKIISAGDNLPEWCQEKIAVAEHMLVSVWDYMQGEQDSESDVSEASALEKFRKAASEREKKHNDAEKEMKARHARGEEDMKGSIDRLEKHVNTKEGWTHDSLAAQLFETENTYEDRLTNLLNKRLGK